MSKQLTFSKMHGLGNDFVVINAIAQTVDLTPEQVRFLADRHRGVGCDQLLLVESSTRPGIDFRYRIFNADGGEVEQCGNGARCFARYVRNHGLTDKDEIQVETAGGDIVLKVQPDGEVTVDMGIPNFDPRSLPLSLPLAPSYEVWKDQERIEFGAVSMGNPHAVIRVDDVAEAAVHRIGPWLERHDVFPRRVNVGFLQVITPQYVRLRVFERGSGETLACGTGACAAVVVARQWGLLGEQVRVDLPGGSLRIAWGGQGQHVFMTGPAVEVFTAQIHLP